MPLLRPCWSVSSRWVKVSALAESVGALSSPAESVTTHFTTISSPAAGENDGVVTDEAIAEGV